MKTKFLNILLIILSIFVLTGCTESYNNKYNGKKTIELTKEDIKFDKVEWLEKFNKKIENINTFYSKQTVTKNEDFLGTGEENHNYKVEETYEIKYDRTNKDNIKYHMKSELYRYERFSDGTTLTNRDKINEYVKDGVKYRNYKMQIITNNKKDEKEYKEKWLEWHMTYFTPAIEFERFLKYINNTNVEYGYDKNGNFVIQDFIDIDNKKQVKSRCVFKDELLVYSYSIDKNFENGRYNNTYIYEFKYTPFTIKYLDFTGYTDITGEHHH